MENLITWIGAGNNWIIVAIGLFLFKDQIFALLNKNPQPAPQPTNPAPQPTVPTTQPKPWVDLVTQILPVLLPMIEQLIKTQVKTQLAEQSSTIEGKVS